MCIRDRSLTAYMTSLLQRFTTTTTVTHDVLKSNDLIQYFTPKNHQNCKFYSQLLLDVYKRQANYIAS